MREVLKRTVSIKAVIAIAAILIALSASLAYAFVVIISPPVTVTTIGGAVITVTGDLEVTVDNLAAAPEGKSEVMGGVGSEIEITPTTYATANTAITQNHWVIDVTIQESAVDSVATAKKFKVDVTGITASTLYIEQATIDDSNIEGIVCTYDLGSDITGLTLMITVTEYT
jgi:hypothetical protein